MNYFKGKGATLVNTWSSGKQYDSGVLVYYEGDYYISTRLVPRGIKISDFRYWVPTNNLSITLADMQDDIGDNSSNISSLSSRVTKVEKAVADYDDLSTQVSTNSSNIATLQSDVDDLQDDIDVLSAKVNTANYASVISGSDEITVESYSTGSTDTSVRRDEYTISLNTDSAKESLGVNQNTEDIAELAALLLHNSGAHNSLYRGKYLGTEVTDDQYEAISEGTFEGLYIGDYWTINGVNWRIAAFDYYYNCGDTNCTTHHVVIVPDSVLYSAVMNTEATTEGGYVGSEMYTTNLDTAKETIEEVFGSDHILSHRVYLTTAVTSGYPSSGAWYDNTVELMNEQMAYGGSIFMPIADGSGVYTNYRVEKSQLPLFAMNPRMIGIRSTWWLRDVVSASFFALVAGHGGAYCGAASNSRGVRPAFCICAA